MLTPPPTLAHGTRPFVAKRASRHGLKPRGLYRGSAWDIASRHDSVYLTDSYAFHYAKNATRETDVGLVEVDPTMLMQERFIADEDAIAQCMNPDDGLSLKQRTLKVRPNLEQWAMQGYGAAWSLGTLGNCAHIGAIPPGAVKRVVLLKSVCGVGRHTWFFIQLFDPVVSVLNYRILGPYYRELQKLFLGYDADMETLGTYGRGFDEDHRAETLATINSTREIVFMRAIAAATATP